MNLVIIGCLVGMLVSGSIISYIIGKHRYPLSVQVSPNVTVLQKFVDDTVDQVEPVGYIFGPTTVQEWASLLDGLSLHVVGLSLNWRYGKESEIVSLFGECEDGTDFEIELQDSYDVKSFKIIPKPGPANIGVDR